MLMPLIRKFLLALITLTVLSLISYRILQRDPLNHFSGLEGIEGYFFYAEGLLHCDLGISFSTGEPLSKQLLTVFPATISLCLSASILSLILGLPLGFLTAYQRKNLVGRLLATLGSLSLAVPVFWLAIVLLYVAADQQWEIAAVGEVHPIYQVPVITGLKLVDVFLSDSPHKLKIMQSMLQHLVLPTLILAIPATLEVIRITHQQAEKVMKQHYIKVAQARGWSPWQIWQHHIMRNTLAPIIPLVARNVILIFAFAMLIENIMSWSGVGRWMINALTIQDYNAISAGVMAIGVFVLIVDMVAELMTLLLDPSNKKGWYVK